ncbi:MAG: hypothetical protein QOD42_3387 [Sphingomonadales bacterium]|jgi:hypothetical protein|nr:hypothetical protein [Sphingomonadales bacterium]
MSPTDATTLEFFKVLFGKYLGKLGQERQARLDGRIAEADFHVRQITCLEVSLDMVSGDGMKIMREFRCHGHDLLHIAETDMSRLLDGARRLHWDAAGDPPRPEYPPRHLLVEHEGFSTEPLECIYGGVVPSAREQRRTFDERHARDAKAQVEWEAEARRDYERRREAEPVLSPVEGPRMIKSRARLSRAMPKGPASLRPRATGLTSRIRFVTARRLNDPIAPATGKALRHRPRTRRPDNEILHPPRKGRRSGGTGLNERPPLPRRSGFPHHRAPHPPHRLLEPGRSFRPGGRRPSPGHGGRGARRRPRGG